MGRLHAVWLFATIGSFVWCGWGCSRFPPAPDGPKIGPAEAAKAAITEYDANSDGLLDAEEIGKSAALKMAMPRVDTDGDGKLTASEISARIKALLDAPATLVPCDARVTLDGNMLEGATVTFEPEEFLGPGFKACSGVTNEVGSACIQGPDEKYPGIYLGFYRVIISKKVNGKETIPAKYNTQTQLGHEAATDIPGLGLIQFDLKGGKGG